MLTIGIGDGHRRRALVGGELPGGGRACNNEGGQSVAGPGDAPCVRTVGERTGPGGRWSSGLAVALRRNRGVGIGRGAG